MEPSSEQDEQVETQLMLLDTPFGSDPHLRERDRAADWLVAHAERSYPRLLALLDEGRAGAGAIELLPRFARPESIPRLARLLQASGSATWAAGQALGQHADEAAGEALRAALASSDSDVVVAALDGLTTRGQAADCAAVTHALAADDERVRRRALQSAEALGCLERATLESIAGTDASPDVRSLAAQLLAAR
jgi:HEAT repeat protein